MAKIMYMTAPNQQEALHIGRTLVERRLVACINILGPVNSVFWWDNSVQTAKEVAFIAKTSDENVEETLAVATALHSYETPCAVILPIVDGAAPFLSWLEAQTSKE